MEKVLILSKNLLKFNIKILSLKFLHYSTKNNYDIIKKSIHIYKKNINIYNLLNTPLFLYYKNL